MGKKITPHLKIGDLVRALVRESLRDGHLIVSFDGDLLNVANQTHRDLSPGDEILLRVESTAPLTFKMVSNEKSPARLREGTSWRA